MRPFLTLAVLAATLTACDVTTLDDNDVQVVDFEFDRDAFALSDDGFTASFESDDIASGSARAALEDALATAGDGAVVVAYIESGFFVGSASTGQTYTALPVTRAFRGEIPFDVDNDGQADEFVPAETLLSYEYSFDNEDFYFDVVASDPAGDFNGDQLFSFAIGSDPQLRVVTIPADRLSNKQGVDLTNYAEVKAAFGLPD